MAQSLGTLLSSDVTDLFASANRHWTENIIASADGSEFYAAADSNSHIGNNDDMGSEQTCAAI